MAAGPLVRVISGLTGVHDLDDPALARLTREARCETLVGLAVGNLRAGRSVVLVAPFSTERADPSAWPPRPASWRPPSPRPSRCKPSSITCRAHPASIPPHPHVALWRIAAP